MAMPVTKHNLAKLEQQKAAIEARLANEKSEAENLSAKLSGITIEIARRVGEEDRLFGSVTTTDIAAKLEEMGLAIDKRAIVLGEPIKSLGENKIAVKVGFQLTTEIIVQVVPEAVGD
jgi:large subunit ribosomal protein L9